MRVAALPNWLPGRRWFPVHAPHVTGALPEKLLFLASKTLVSAAAHLACTSVECLVCAAVPMAGARHRHLALTTDRPCAGGSTNSVHWWQRLKRQLRGPHQGGAGKVSHCRCLLPASTGHTIKRPCSLSAAVPHRQGTVLELLLLNSLLFGSNSVSTNRNGTCDTDLLKLRRSEDSSGQRTTPRMAQPGALGAWLVGSELNGSWAHESSAVESLQTRQTQQTEGHQKCAAACQARGGRSG